MFAVWAGSAAGRGADANARPWVNGGRSGAERELVVPLPSVESVQDPVVAGRPGTDGDDAWRAPARRACRVSGPVVAERDQGRDRRVRRREVVQPAVLEA